MASAQAEQTGTHDRILQKAVFLFAQTGFSGVSMRDIANAVGISAAALYHHFPDKGALYLAAVRHAFADKALQGRMALEATGSPETRLQGFIHAMVRLMGSDPDFRRLLHRELLDGDENRLRLLATSIFAEHVKAIANLVDEIAPDFDAHMLVLSIAGMIIHHFESAPMRRFYPGSKPEHDDPGYLANHITRLALYGIKGIPKD